MSGKVFLWPKAQEWWESLRWVCLTFSFLIVLTICGSFVNYERVVHRGHPWLPRVQCTGCRFCGMTRSFCAMSSRHWQEAAHWNRGGPVLYVCCWLWLISGSVACLTVWRRKKRPQNYTQRFH